MIHRSIDGSLIENFDHQTSMLSWTQWVWYAISILPIGLFCYLFPWYLKVNTFFVIGLSFLPFALTKGGIHCRLPLLSIFMGLFSALSFFIPTTIGSFLICCGIPLVFIELKHGKSHWEALMICLLISPFYQFVNVFISIPLRMQLAKMAAWGLQLLQTEITLSGNEVSIGQNHFLIDEGCAGLNMLGYGLLIGLMIFIFTHSRKNPSIWKFLFSMIFLLALIFVSNFIRIVCVVVFMIMPETITHEVIGMICFAVIAMLPYLLLSEKTAHSFQANAAKPAKTWLFKSVTVLLLACAGLILWKVKNYKDQERSQTAMEIPCLDGFSCENINGGVRKMSTEALLIYIKPPVGAFHAHHDPMVCWTGSGFKFKKINTKKYGAISVNTATLEKDNQQLYTAWWFESEKSQIGSPWLWRQHAFKTGEAFALINITANTITELDHEIKKMVQYPIIANSN